MSKYTTEVRFICEELSGLENSVGYDAVENVIANSRSRIFDFDYPIFDESYRSVIETKILKHYYTREIGLETVGLWKLKLNTKMNEIMPFYNEYYKSALIEFNPMYDVDLTTTHEGEDVGDRNVVTDFDGNKDVNTVENVGREQEFSEVATNNGEFNTNVMHAETTENKHDENTTNLHMETTSDSHVEDTTANHNETKDNTHSDNEWNLFSDTPQGGITGIENAYREDLSDNTYLTDARNIRKNGEAHDTIVGSDSKHNVYDGDGTKNYTDTVDNEAQDNGIRNYTNNTANTHSDTNNRNANSNEDVERNVVSNEVVDNNENKVENFTTTKEWIQKMIGKTGGKSYSKMLLEFRDTFVNIDMMVINELKDLFFLLW